ncbi:hypothetical protein BC937DRAFT_93440, partial [Endogone sp. FLAS-F59071]
FLRIAAAVAQNAAARIAADLVARGQGSQVESVALEENMSISASQRYAIMQKLAASREEISPILLVRNAVPISEVDDTLQEEFAEECTNYGKVTKVLIQAVSDGDEETESAGLGTDSGRKEGDGDVRIFVQFADGECEYRISLRPKFDKATSKFLYHSFRAGAQGPGRAVVWRPADLSSCVRFSQVPDWGVLGLTVSRV